MREIKFRGFRTDSQEWVKGFFIHDIIPFIRIYEDGYFDYEIDKKSLSQFINMYDGNGKEIYEGDIIKNENGEAFFISWRSPMFILENKNGATRGINYNLNMWKVIGTIHENPELLN